MLARQVNVKVEFQTSLFHLGNVWQYVGKHESLLTLFTMHKSVRSSLATTVGAIVLPARLECRIRPGECTVSCANATREALLSRRGLYLTVSRAGLTRNECLEDVK